MKNIILLFLVAFISCKKDNHVTPDQTPVTKTCSPVHELEGKWSSDSCRKVIIKNNVVDQDTTFPYSLKNTKNGYMNLDFGCYENTPFLTGGTNSITLDGSKYQVFGSVIYIGNDSDTSKMEKMYINSLAGNKLVLKFTQEHSETTKSYSYISMIK